MAKKPETVFKERVLYSLNRLPQTWAEKIQQVSICGTPDIVGCMNGCFFALELKSSEKAKVDKLQLQKLELIAKRAGGFAAIVYPENWESTLEVLLSYAGINIEEMSKCLN